MARTIIIGKEGEQPFPITAGGVSRQHARLTISDDDQWLLEDLNSTNGTYIFDTETQTYERIQKRIITPSTEIRLGSDATIRSMEFKAIQVAKEDPNNFTYEFQDLQNKWQLLQEKKARMEQHVTRTSFLPAAASLILILATFCFPSNWSATLRMNAMRAVMMVPALISPIINNSNKKRLKRLNDEIKHTFVCPNPQCRRPLSENEIIKGQCLVCKKHI